LFAFWPFDCGRRAAARKATACATATGADICEISTELEAEEKPRPATPRPRSSPPARPIAAAVVRGPSTPVADCPATSAGLAWPGRGCRTVPWHGTARLRDLRCVAAVARQARMLRSPKLQCESGRTARGSSRPRLRAPASGGIPRNLQLDETAVVAYGRRLRRPDLGCDGCCDVRT
jgi:hypothetical protein